MSEGDGRDRGLAFERTTLAWQRTGLSALATAAVTVKALQHRLVLAGGLGVALAAIGLLALRTGATPPASPARLRTISLAVTLVAVVTAGSTIVG